MNQSNPLKQYFRRPVLYVKLPSGGNGYPMGTLDMPANSELPVYPMTAIDEITSKTPDALFNGTAVVEIIKSCVPSIKDPWAMPSVDLDAVLIAIKSASSDGEMDVETICPKCGDTAKYDVNLSMLLRNISAEGFNKELNVGDLMFKFKPLTYAQVNQTNTVQFELQRKLNNIRELEDEDERNEETGKILAVVNDMALNSLIDTIEYIKTPEVMVTEREFITEFLRNCDRNIYNKIKELNIKVRNDSEMKPIHIQCNACTHEYDQPLNLNFSDFFV